MEDLSESVRTVQPLNRADVELRYSLRGAVMYVCCRCVVIRAWGHTHAVPVSTPAHAFSAALHARRRSRSSGAEAEEAGHCAHHAASGGRPAST